MNPSFNQQDVKHYEKLCPQKPHYPTTKDVLKQLLQNYATTMPWEYKELKNKVSRYQFIEFYYNCVLVLRQTLVWMNECVHRIYNIGQPCLTLLANCIRVIYNNYNTTRINEALVNKFFATTL